MSNKDTIKAKWSFRLAKLLAALGNAHAMFSLGCYYEETAGAGGDIRIAAQYYTKAAGKGQSLLGISAKQTADGQGENRTNPLAPVGAGIGHRLRHHGL